MDALVINAIEDFKRSEFCYTKFITPNDTGVTGGHQSGFHIHKNAWALFFDSEGIKGSNKDVFITIKWQNDFETQSRFIYYGTGTRNEYRLTRFGRGFPFLQEENVGDYLILCRKSEDYYHAYVLHHDDDIEDFTSSAGISVTDTNRLFRNDNKLSAEELTEKLIQDFTKHFIEFPTSKIVSGQAQRIYEQINPMTAALAINNPDALLLGWIDTEYRLFKAIEKQCYAPTVGKGFESLDLLIDIANTILNRRKSRAGKSLENHLAAIFDLNKVQYETQVKTEGNKKPDFIFPNGKSYHDTNFQIENLFFLGAKTTCKDRWRQILNEANRIETKHLMTLQQGISKNQLEEMQQEKVVLVVPENYISSFPKEYRSSILSLEGFIRIVKIKQTI